MRLPAAGCHVPVDRRQRMGKSAVNFSRHDAARHEVTTARCSHCAVIPSPQCTMSTLFWIRAVRTGVALCSGQVFSSTLLLASRSGLQRISFTIGVSGWHSLPDFRPRSVKDSGALRRSGATGTNFGTYCTTINASSADAMVEGKSRGILLAPVVAGFVSYAICASSWTPALLLLPVSCCPHGVIRFQHRRKIRSIHIRDTVAPIAIRTTSGSCSLRDVKSPKPGAVMNIPLDLQRRCEQRWASRFSRPIPSAAPRNQRLVKESLQIAAPAKSKEKPAGSKRPA